MPGPNVIEGGRVDLSKLIAELRLAQSLPFPTGIQQIVWVSSTSGSNNNPGTHPSVPKSTVGGPTGAALTSFITANSGMIIVAMEGHRETISTPAGLAFADAGVSLVGLGHGSSRPIFNFSGAADASMAVTGNGLFGLNCVFAALIDSLTGYIELDATDITLMNCETRDAAGRPIDTIVAGTTTACDRLRLINHVHRGASAVGATSAIRIIGGDGISIVNPWIDGNFSAAAIENVTAPATNLCLFGGPNCYMRTRNVADVIFKAHAATTGCVRGPIAARLQENAPNITEAFVGAAMNFYQPISIANADGETGLDTNIVASADI